MLRGQSLPALPPATAGFAGSRPGSRATAGSGGDEATNRQFYLTEPCLQLRGTTSGRRGFHRSGGGGPGARRSAAAQLQLTPDCFRGSAGCARLLIESRSRARQSQLNVAQDRRITQSLMHINDSLDSEMERIFESLVLSKGVLKMGALPLLRVSADGRRTENAEGPQEREKDKSKGRSSVVQDLCAVCSEAFRPGQCLRQMSQCCQAPIHASCMQSYLASNTLCPRCEEPVLTAKEVRELAA
eukprot:TRINITY_DN37075_c1_g1_i1.p1 TRINITY_DN37075_c1_g1~~TRINITY_DN37075_c1_g1_i1.p1  ORF type:complete len:279 (-),score=36.21 TRINITY_DN37075_c1_g1_i1:132-860(-)